MSEFEDKNPDTDTNDDIEEEGGGGFIPPAIPVAEPSSEPEPRAAAAAPAPAPSGPPRPFPQHYRLLMANVFIVAGCLTLWERAHVGSDVVGYHTVGGAIVFGLGLYSLIATIICMLRGGVNMFGSLLTATLALYFGVRYAIATYQIQLVDMADGTKKGFRAMGNIEEDFPNMAFQAKWDYLLGQFGPGLYLCGIGGLLVYWMFLKALFGGGKKEEPAPSRGTRRRR